MMEEKNAQQPPPMPEEPDEFKDDIKAMIDSISSQDEDLSFYAEGLVSFSNFLDSKAKQDSFKKNQGFSVLIRHERIRVIMGKVIEDMFPEEMQVLKAAYTLARAASKDHKDNTVRSMQIRGILDNVYEMCSSTKRIPEDVFIEGIRHAIISLSDTNVSKLMCNKYDLTEVDKFDSDYGHFGRNLVRANIWQMLKTGRSDTLQREAFKLVETISKCPRFYARVVDQQDAKLDKIAETITQGLVKGSQQPISFGAFCDAVYRLCQHTKIRAALMRQPGLIAAAREAVENLLDEVSTEGAASLGRMLLCLNILLLDMPPSQESDAECGKLREMVDAILDSNRAAGTRRCARAAATALEMRRLQQENRVADLFEACMRMFLEHYDANYNTTDEFGPTPQLITNVRHLLEMFNGTELFDAPPLFYAGAFRCLGRAMKAISSTGDELYTKFKENGGFDMMVRHRAIPLILKMPLEEMRLERYVMMSIWDLGLNIMPHNRDTLLRYIQMPNVVDYAVELIRKPNIFPALMHTLSMEMMIMVCESRDTCRMVNNRIDFPPFMIELFSIPLEFEGSELVDELHYRFYKKLVVCPKLNHRLTEETNFVHVIDGYERLIQDGWSRPIMFRRMLDCACSMYNMIRPSKTEWHRQSMMEATTTAISLMSTMTDVPDVEASVNLVRFAEVLLRRERNEELQGALQMVIESDCLPEECRTKATACLEQLRQHEEMSTD